MKLGVFSPVLASMSFKEMVEYLSKLGVQQLEMGAGGYPGKAAPPTWLRMSRPSKSTRRI